jgi:hypothetical protein
MFAFVKIIRDSHRRGCEPPINRLRKRGKVPPGGMPNAD